MINLEKLSKLIDIDSTDSICYLSHKLKYKRDCDNKYCEECEFNEIKNCINYLKREYQEPIELNRFEYDLLSTYCESYDIPTHRVKSYTFFNDLRGKGHFKNVDLTMTFGEILERAVVVDD